ncbi:MAG TPA: 30S ribosomal protein S9 [Candidatus Saccharimonadales bacterium]|nr:30S ribosomal protein S9 [Candidatus Saccharimonadales bacterium]
MATSTKNNFFAGVGRRKTAVAQIRLTSGNGKFSVNHKEAELPAKVGVMFELVGRTGQLDISAVTRGGGYIGQIDAIVLGVARALVELNPDFRSTLRKAGFLTRDARIKERKKPGLKGARKAPQWAKR